MIRTYLLLAGCLLCTVLFVFKHEAELSKTISGEFASDFPIYYLAGKRLFSGQAVYGDIKEEVSASLGWQDYRSYPADTPLAITVLSPLSLLEPLDASLVLHVLSIMIGAASIYCLAREVGLTTLYSTFLVTAGLSSLPFFFLLKKGHAEIFLLAFATAGLIAAARGFRKTAGIFFGAAAAFKLFPFLTVLSFIKDRRIFLSGIGAFLFFSLAGALAVGVEETARFALEIIPKSKLWYGVAGNYSLVSFSTALIGESGIYLGLALSTIILALFLRAVFAEKLSRPRAYALSASAALLCSPLSWLNYYILTFPIFIYLIAQMDFANRKNLWAFVFISVAFWNWPEYIRAGGVYPTILLSFLPLFAMLTIFFYLQKKL